MKSQTWIASHDLGLMFDPSGRLWKFRASTATHSHQPIDAGIVDDTIVITVAVPGLEPGDVDLRVDGDVLEIRGKTHRATSLAYDVGLPMTFGLDQVETAYGDEALAIRVLPPAKVRERAASATDSRDEIEMPELLPTTTRVAV